MDNLKKLMEAVSELIELQKTNERSTGRNFNIFSIMRAENNENKTHSAFIGELLNPRGSHLLGNLFLTQFLETVGNKEAIDPNSATVKLEHYIGVRDVQNKAGGRIDIWLKDRSGKTISIENKIYAGDQTAQIERYKNAGDNNTVYYLTLFGTDATPESAGNLKSGTDYLTISYQEHIRTWLENCLKKAEVKAIPRLHHTIDQYLQIIKKITGIMDHDESIKLSGIILENYESCLTISSNIERVRQEFNEEIRQCVMKELEGIFQSEPFKVVSGDDASKRFSTIYVEFTDFPESSLKFGMESFSGDQRSATGGDLMIGICNLKPDEKGAQNIAGFEPEYGGYWYNSKRLEFRDQPVDPGSKRLEFRDQPVNLGNAQLIQHLHIDASSRKLFIRDLAKDFYKYVHENSDKLRRHLKTQSGPAGS